jgi:hypothetical protein
MAELGLNPGIWLPSLFFPTKLQLREARIKARLETAWEQAEEAGKKDTLHIHLQSMIKTSSCWAELEPVLEAKGLASGGSYASSLGRQLRSEPSKTVQWYH